MKKFGHESNDEFFEYTDTLIKVDLNDNYKMQGSSYEAVKFVMLYCQKYEDIEELSSVEYPLSSGIPLTELFNEETDIFGALLLPDFNPLMESENVSKFKFMYNIIEVADILELEVLMQKMSAIITYYLVNSPSKELQDIVNSLNKVKF
jgi:hypothetical protein